MLEDDLKLSSDEEENDQVRTRQKPCNLQHVSCRDRDTANILLMLFQNIHQGYQNT